MLHRLSLSSIFSPLLKASLFRSTTVLVGYKQVGEWSSISKTKTCAGAAQIRSLSDSIVSNSTSEASLVHPFVTHLNYTGTLNEWQQSNNGTFKVSYQELGHSLWVCNLVVTTPQGLKTFSEMSVSKKKAMKMAAHKACVELGLLNAW